MDSRIIKTLEKVLNKDIEIKQSEVQEVVGQIEYFEKFVNAPETPAIVDMINQIIIGQANSITDPKMSIESRGYGTQMVISESGLLTGHAISVGYKSLIGIEIRTGRYNERDYSGPVVHINSVGDARTDWETLQKKGVLIQGYNLSSDILNVVVKDFMNVSGKDRNEVLLKLAASDDITRAYPENHWVNFHKQTIEKYGTTQEGIDERAVWTLEKPGEKISVYGNAHGFHKIPEYTCTIRVERQNIEFKL